jgi:hypothetical protein
VEENEREWKRVEESRGEWKRTRESVWMRVEVRWRVEENERVCVDESGSEVESGSD